MDQPVWVVHFRTCNAITPFNETGDNSKFSKQLEIPDKIPEFLLHRLVMNINKQLNNNNCIFILPSVLARATYPLNGEREPRCPSSNL